jgi:hypothetical protein
VNSITSIDLERNTAILQLRLRKRNSGTFHTALRKLQDAEEGVKEDDGYVEDEDR